jgi:hypothetical protein
MKASTVLTRRALAGIAATLAWSCLAPSYTLASEDTPKTAMEADGLVRIDVSGIDEVYARPKADLHLYDKVILDPIEVAFRKDWDPRPGGVPVSAEEKQDIRDGLARVLRDAFGRELTHSRRYQVVTAPGEGVLRIKAEIRDLYINAPDLPRAGRVQTYTLSVGEMTLVAELRDAPTGDLIARVFDRKRDPESVWLELTTRVENIAAAQRAAAAWAQALREQLDEAHRALR